MMFSQFSLLFCLFFLVGLVHGTESGEEVSWHSVGMKAGIFRAKPIYPRESKKKKKDFANPHLDYEDFVGKVEEAFGSRQIEEGSE